MELYFDVISPYSWMAFEQLIRYKDLWQLDLILHPFYLGAVMKASQNQPPGLNAFKAKYLMEDVKRLSMYMQLPLTQPSNFFTGAMFSGLQPMRMMTAVQMAHPDKVAAVARAFWTRLWSHDQEIASEQGLLAALKLGGVTEAKEQTRLMEMMKSHEVKERLKAVTNSAVEMGAFGAPFFIAHINGKKEVFFGSDRMEVLAFMLGKVWMGPCPDQNTLKLKLKQKQDNQHAKVKVTELERGQRDGDGEHEQKKQDEADGDEQMKKQKQDEKERERFFVEFMKEAFVYKKERDPDWIRSNY